MAILLLLGLLVAAAEHASNVAAGTLDAVSGTVGDALGAVSNTGDGAVHSTSAGDVGGGVTTAVVLALAFGAVDALLGGEVADGLEKTALADLTGGEVVDAVLEGVDLLDAGDLCLVKVLWRWSVSDIMWEAVYQEHLRLAA